MLLKLTWVLLLLAIVWSTKALDCLSTIYDVEPQWDDVKGPWSCEHRCGETYTQLPCACDHLCQLNEDCCDDFNSSCSSRGGSDELDLEDPAAEKTTRKSVNAPLPSSFIIPPVSIKASETTPDADDESETKANRDRRVAIWAGLLGTVECRHSAKLVSKCPRPAARLPQYPILYGNKRIDPDEVGYRCDTPFEKSVDVDVLQAVPVTDAALGIHFANVYCLLCHGGLPEDGRPWALGFVWNVNQLQAHERDRRTQRAPLRAVDVLQLARQLGTKTVAVPPPGVTPRRCFQGGAGFHRSFCDCPRLDRLCETALASPIGWNQLVFRNPYCMLCHVTKVKNNTAAISVGMPDMESLALSRYRNTFAMLMRWTSDPVGSTTVSVQMDTNVVSRQWASRAGFRTESAGSSAEGGQNDTGTTENVKRVYVDGKGGHEVSEVISDEGTDIADIGSRDTDDANGQVSPDASGTEDKSDAVMAEFFVTDCHKDQCVSFSAVLDGECRSDITSFSQVLLSCRPRDSVSTSFAATLQQQQNVTDDVIDLTSFLQSSCEACHRSDGFHIAKALATRTTISPTAWNLTVSLLVPREGVNTTMNRLVASVAYRAFQHVVHDTTVGKRDQSLHVFSALPRSSGGEVSFEDRILHTTFLPLTENLASPGGGNGGAGKERGLGGFVAAAAVLALISS